MTLNILMIGAMAIMVIMLIEKHLENKMLIQKLFEVNDKLREFDEKLNKFNE